MRKRRYRVSFSQLSEAWGLTFVRSQGEIGSLEQHLRRPTVLLFSGIFIALLILAGRAGQLTLIEGTRHRDLADGNRIRAASIPAPRGDILDQGGVVIARNAADWRATVTPGDLPQDPAHRLRVLHRLSALTGTPVGELENLLKADSRSTAVVVARALDLTTALTIRSEYTALPGVSVEAAPVREYPYGPLYAHLLGYTGRIDERELASVERGRYAPEDQIGKTGLEAKYEDLLHGINGARQLEVDSLGRPVRNLAGVDPLAGTPLHLTIDHRLQLFMRDRLEKMVEEVGATGAVGVALDPRSGAVRGYVSLPSFDPNPFSRGISEDDYRALLHHSAHPLLDRVMVGTYPPGSTIKPFIGAVALDAGTITPQTTINGPKEIVIGGQSFPDYQARGPGVNLQRALMVSSNVFFYGVGGGFDIAGVGKISGLGIERLSAGLSRFAFGQPTGIDLPGEGSGVIPTPEWKRRVKGESWYLGDTYHASIGQGELTVTPLQLATSLAAIANGGTIYRPYLLDRAGDGKKKSPHAVRNLGFSESALSEIRKGMRETVRAGSARSLASLPVEVAGKTGTAEFGPDNSSTHAWFEAYAPANDPTIALVVMIEGGGESFEAAVPPAKDILAAYFASS
jgi:penicillin-binding protein 2